MRIKKHEYRDDEFWRIMQELGHRLQEIDMSKPSPNNYRAQTQNCGTCKHIRNVRVNNDTSTFSVSKCIAYYCRENDMQVEHGYICDVWERRQ